MIIGILPMGIERSELGVPKMKTICPVNYSRDKYIQLCESWDNMCLILSPEMSNLVTPIESEFIITFISIEFAFDRNANSLEHSWETVRKECQKFQSLFEEVERHHPTAVPYKKHVKTFFIKLSRIVFVKKKCRNTCLWFQLLETQNTYAKNDPKKKGFSFLHCWPEIRHSEMFLAVASIMDVFWRRRWRG